MSEFRKSRGLVERGDPVGPSFEEIQQRERLRLIKEGRKNFDPRLGGSPVFRQLPEAQKRRPIWQRYPKGWAVALCLFTVGGFYGPMFYSSYKAHQTPMTELEKREAKIINAAIDREYGDSWFYGFILKRREE